jgi:hypothetical protein
MTAKKAKNNDKVKKTASKKPTKKNLKSKAKGKGPKKSELVADDIGIVVIEDDIKIDKDAELEARRLYLEEARSQEASD